MPLAATDVDNELAEEDILDIRESGDYQSANQMTEAECGEWRENNQRLFNRKYVVYEDLDQRRND